MIALGLDPRTAISPEERVFTAYVELIRQRRDFVTQSEIGRHIGMGSSTVQSCVDRLISQGRLLRGKPFAPGRWYYVPKVAA